MAEQKTNVMRVLEQKKIKYTPHSYPHGDDAVDGLTELDLKKAAKAVGEKSIEMVHVSEINALTGYIRGGCSPVGMRKHYTTTYDASALAQDTMIVSAGKIGFQVELEPQALIRITQGKTADVTVG